LSHDAGEAISATQTKISYFKISSD